MALRARRRRRLPGAARGGAAARQAARARHLQHHRARRLRRASKAPRSGSTAAAPSPCLRASINQGQGHETVFKQIVCDRLGIDPGDIVYLQGDTDQVFFGEGTGGSRSATLGRIGRGGGRGKVIEKANAIAAARAQGRHQGGELRRRRVLGRLDQRDAHHQGGREARGQSAQGCPRSIEPGLVATAVYRAEVDELSQRLPRLRARDRPRDRRGRRSSATAWSTTSGPCSIRCCCTARSSAALRRGSGRSSWRTSGSIPLPGSWSRDPSWTTRCRGRSDLSAVEVREQSGADRDQSARRQGRRRSGQRSARCRRSPTRSSTRCPNSASATSRCRRRPSASGGRCRAGEGLPNPVLRIGPLDLILRDAGIEIGYCRFRHQGAEVGQARLQCTSFRMRSESG